MAVPTIAGAAAAGLVVVPVDVEASTAGLAAGGEAGDVPVEPPLVPVEPPLVPVEAPLVSVEPPLVPVKLPLVPVAPDASDEAAGGLDPASPPLALPVPVAGGVLEEEPPEPEVEVSGLEGLCVVVGPLPPPEGPPDDGGLPEPDEAADGPGDVTVTEPAGGPAAGPVGVRPACGLPAVPGGSSELAAADVVGVELDVEPPEPDGVVDGPEVGLPSGVAVTVDGAPVTGARAAGVPAGAVDPPAEASRP